MGLACLSAVVGHSACFTPKATVGYVDSGDFPTSSGSVKRHLRSRVRERGLGIRLGEWPPCTVRKRGICAGKRRGASIGGGCTEGQAYRPSRAGCAGLGPERCGSSKAPYHSPRQKDGDTDVAVSIPDYNTIYYCYNGSIL